MQQAGALRSNISLLCLGITSTLARNFSDCIFRRTNITCLKFKRSYSNCIMKNCGSTTPKYTPPALYKPKSLPLVCSPLWTLLLVCSAQLILLFMYYYIIFSFKVILKQLLSHFQTQIVFQLQVPSFGSSLFVNCLTFVTSLLPNIHPYLPMVSYCIGNNIPELYW